MTVDAGGAQIPAEVSQRFRATVPLYAGATSVLYEGTDPTTGKIVLVKVLRDAAIISPAEKQRILRELQKLSQVRHPSLVPIIASGEADGRVWLVREHVDGQSVGARLANGGPMPPGLASRVAAQMAAALGELHRNGVLHRDLRPGHVLLDATGHVRVIDAAVSRVTRLADGRPLTGTAGYVAPEAIAGKLVSFRSDLYSLGVVIFEMLHGQAPYGSPDTINILQHQIERDAPMVRVPAPPALSRLIASLLSREPRERPFSAQQLERQLEPLSASATETMDEEVARTMITDERADEMTTVVPEMSEISRSRAAPPRANENEFEDDQPTRVGESAFVVRDASSPAVMAPKASSAPAISAPPPSTSQPAISAPPMRTHSSPAIPAMNARVSTSSPAINAPPSRSFNAPTAGPPRKATMIGVPPPSASLPRASSGMAAAPELAPHSSNHAAPLEGSGRIQRPAPDETDFDEAIDTVVTEDSRIFGVPEVQGGSPHGSAVPPLPDAVAARVLTGSVHNGAVISRGTATASSPAMPAPGMPAPGMPGGAFGPPAAMAAPMNANPPPQNGQWTQQTAPTGPPQNTWAPNNAPVVAPNVAVAPPPPSPQWGPPPGAPAAFAPPPGYPPPNGYAGPTGQFPPPVYQGQPTYQPQPYAGYVAPAPRRVLLPWILAGIGVAGIAGAAGYFFASHDRTRQTQIAAPVPLVAPVPTAPMAPPVRPAIVVAPPVAPVTAHPVPAPVANPRVVAVPRVVAPTPVAPAPVIAPAPVVVPAPAPVVAASPPASAHNTSTHSSSSHSSTHTTTTPADAHAHVAPPSARGSLAQAHAAFDHRDYAQARTLANAAVREQPSSAEAHALLADVLARQNDASGSLNEWRAASRLAPRNTDYLHRIATLQLDRFDRQGAITTLRQIVQINPRDATAQRQLSSLTGTAAPAPASTTQGTHPAPVSTTQGTTARPAPATTAHPATAPAHPAPAHHDDPFVPTFGAPVRAGTPSHAGSIRR